MSANKIAIASDHAGLPLKMALKDMRPDLEWIDLGTHTLDSVDYPDYAVAMADCLGKKEAHRGILICGTGIGISIAANRHKHIRAGVCHDVTTARLTRMDNDANVLCLGARIIGINVALDCLEAFLKTDFAGNAPDGERHNKRVEKLS
jgi:ribose 5-phosphate isomerase B